MVKSLEECFERIARANNSNGKRMTRDDYIARGAKIFRDEILSKTNPVILSKQQAADILVYLQAVKIPKDARDALNTLSEQYEVSCDEGILYIEKLDRWKFAFGYSP